MEQERWLRWSMPLCLVAEKRTRCAVLRFFLASIAFLFLFSLPAHSFPALCIGISDGDTITVLNDENQQIKIRLYGIDSPESGQPYGRKAKQNMSALVFGKDVEATPIGQKHYGRTVARVSVGGLDVCEEQLRAGYAWVFPRYCKLKICREWETIEAEARAARRGLWQDKAPIPPWEWRKEKKRKK